MNQEEKLQKIKEILMKYTDLKPEFNGVTAYSLAIKILNAIDFLD